ncbi:PAH-inducible cytochrome P450 monooxygenase PC-PAH 1 [Dendrothele bispora CBS 962.96]|uniref:PAH-inducible cytochrome P450 monooxygenase PC-PAH 1 n=1 Tax=Dendrothele bispora (strain CBS 962.96) TaxID=1314807 RepID=A0A4S8LL81_DENBC|nr:PAH-inducible cytochrome P450 monooxygenase PC-PAH 1 [Dendrothele bispora CBS 962.96]
MDHLSSVTTVCILFASVLFARFLLARKTLKFLRGPPSPSWLFGHEYEFFKEIEVGKLSEPWILEYGSTFRFSGSFGEDVLYLADPRGLQHVLQTSSYHYPKPRDAQNSLRRIFGNGIVTVDGSTHQRHRKALNPAFSASQLKTFLSLFQRSTERLVNKWQKEYFVKDKDRGYQFVPVTTWFSRLTLDIIGESAFGYKFGALENKETTLSSILRHLFDDTTGSGLSKVTTFFKALRRELPVDPSFYNPLNPETPLLLTREDKRFNRWLEAAENAAKNILQNNAESGQRGAEEGSKDILSVLVRSNNVEDPKKRLDDKEVLAQMATIILAGHETTAGTTSWLFYELSRHPEQQQRILEEIDAIKLAKLDAGADGVLTSHDYDSMPFFNACIKEALRMYAIVITLTRCTDRDDVVPLSEPVISASGEKLTQIPVKKGQRIIIDVTSYNRLKSVWGEDADKWNPERFLDSKAQPTIALGVYSNLMTFSAGVRACIGWRFALQEMQTILAGLIPAFEFSIDPTADVFRAQLGGMVPMIRGKETEGPQMPLMVRPRALNKA